MVEVHDRPKLLSLLCSVAALAHYACAMGRVVHDEAGRHYRLFTDTRICTTIQTPYSSEFILYYVRYKEINGVPYRSWPHGFRMPISGVLSRVCALARRVRRDIVF